MESFKSPLWKVQQEIRDFTKKHINIPRKDMPQIKVVHFNEFKKWLKDNSIPSSTGKIDARKLNATQANLNNEIVQSILDKGNKDKRPVLITQGGYVLDGHHRVLASRINGDKINTIKIDLPIKDVLRTIARFPKVLYYKDAK